MSDPEAAKRLIAEALANFGGGDDDSDGEDGAKPQPLSAKRRKVKFPLQSINAQIACSLCAGYLVSATTISECLHTFCKSCIVKHFRRTRHCPVCNLLVHETNPLETLRPDRNLQAIVYKIVPHVQQAEEQAQREFLGITEEASPTKPDDNGEPLAKRLVPDPDDQLGFQLIPYTDPDKPDASALEPMELPYIRTSSQVTIQHLKKLLALKLKNVKAVDVDVLCHGEVLGQEFTLEFVVKTRWRKTDTHLILHYRPKLVMGLV
eukprot:TRINITY_DN7303_c0_g1_i1.p1 TRINITY_DN7303_c0_g1~~TRINITY_DN7303_c0_g1_i1.p1  ORF type:complete len:263 (+),score=55.81 TRINITY_DN7303_c0_g1_i1:111-899(+)